MVESVAAHSSVLDDVLRELQALVDAHIRDPELCRQFGKLDTLIREAALPGIHVQQYVNQVAEQARVIGVNIEQRGIDPELITQLKQILEHLVNLQRSRAFVSSTWEDLRSYRRAVIDYLDHSVTYEPVSIDKLNPQAVHPTELSLQNIEQCDVFLGIYGERYGSPSPEPRSDVQISFTELELRHARRHFKRCFCFLSSSGVLDLRLRPPDRPCWPKPPPGLIAPRFSEYYQRPYRLRWIWDTLLSWFTQKPGPRLLMARARSEHERMLARIKAINERETAKYLSIIENMRREYVAAYAEYERQVWGQTALRNTVREALPYYEFGSLQELVAQVDSAFGQFQRLEMIGLAPSDAARRWSSWMHVEQEALAGAPLYWRPLLPSSFERTVVPFTEDPQTESIWRSFIGNEWHEQVRELCGHAQHIALTLQSDPDVGEFVDLPDPLPDGLFQENYEHITSESRTWCCEHEVEQQVVRDRLSGAFYRARAVHDQWKTAVEALWSTVKHSQINLDTRGRAHVDDLIEQVRQSEISVHDEALLSGAAELPSMLPDNFFDQEDQEVKRRLLAWCELHKEAQERITEHLEETAERTWSIFSDWCTEMANLGKIAREPCYGRCLLVVGRSGSGKTHLIARLLGHSAQEGNCAVHLRRPQSIEDWEVSLLKVAQLELQGDQSGPRWRSLEELDSYLGGRTVERFPSARLVILIDRLEDWVREDSTFLTRFATFVREHTQLHTLYWVLALSEYAYDSVVDYEDFWTQYGFHARDQWAALPGWLSLDDMNEQTEIWESILENKLHHGREVVGNIRQQLVPSSLQLICVPFIAWIIAELLEAGDLLDELLNLNYIDFVHGFWSLRLGEMSKVLSEQLGIGTLRPELIRAVWHIARQFAANGKEHFGERQLSKYLISCDRGETKISEHGVSGEIVEALAQKGLLVRLHDPEQIAEEGRTIHLSILPFWQYWGGQWLASFMAQHRYDQEVARRTFTMRFGSPADGPTSDSVSGLLEFTILCLDQAAAREGGTPNCGAAMVCVQQLTQFVIKELEGMRRTIWLAATKASPTYQRALGQWLDEQPPLLLDQREELYMYMYFLKNAKLLEQGSGIPSHQRLKLLQPHYTEIGRLKLESYFASLIERILVKWVGCEETARAIAHLYGTESFWDPERWSSWAFEHLCSLATHNGGVNWDTVAKCMLTMLTEVSKMLKDCRAVLARFSQDEEEMDERDRLWTRVVGKFCDAVVANWQVRSINWLDQHAWFKWSDQHVKMNPLVEKVMEEQLTTTLGWWYYTASSEEKDEYISKKDEYISKLEVMVFWRSCPLERVTAAFLIYHTIPKAQTNLKLDDDLWRLFDTLHKDRHPMVRWIWRIEDLEGFYNRQRNLHSEGSQAQTRSAKDGEDIEASID